MPEIVNKNPVNEAGSKPVKTHSTFRPNYSLYQTPQFGLNTPFFGMAGVTGDEISMRLSSDIDTFTLKAPTMTPVKRSVDYFMLPLRCLLPNMSELIITNPLRGDDVDAQVANCVIPVDSNGSSYLEKFILSFVNDWSTISQPLNPPADNTTFNKYIAKCLGFLQIGGRLFSRQSLMKQFGYSVITDALEVSQADQYGEFHYMSFDKLYQMMYKYLYSVLSTKTGSAASFTVGYTKATGTTGSFPPSFTYSTVFKTYGVNVDEYGRGSLADLINDLFSGDLLVSSVSGLTFNDFLDGSNNWINPWHDAVANSYPSLSLKGSGLSEPINLLRLLAYQKACAEFYTVDTVDDVYSARLWEDNQRAIATHCNSFVPLQISYNGIFVELDSCSGGYLQNLFDQWLVSLSNAVVAGSNLNPYVTTWMYFNNLFNYTRSLRYQDYFAGARVRPLAVGDVTVPVQSGTYVDVIDVSKKIQVQRFLNQVNRIGRKFSDYVKGILGDKPMNDAHEPIFLGHTVDTIGAEETQNTGAAQWDNVAITSRYRNNSSRYAFTVHVPEPAILIGIQNYDIPRVYASATDRENFHVDRYDAFNPYMQFVGDQPIMKCELVPGAAGNFGYTQRYSEYKQRVSMASGGFCDKEQLPGYAKILNDRYFLDANLQAPEISSEFIRAKLNDLDEFYTQRLVDSPVSAFNFIVRNDMEVTAHRPMAFNPSIL